MNLSLTAWVIGKPEEVDEWIEDFEAWTDHHPVEGYSKLEKTVQRFYPNAGTILRFIPEINRIRDGNWLAVVHEIKQALKN